MDNLKNIQQFNRRFNQEPSEDYEALPKPDEWQIKFDKLPEQVQNWMVSIEASNTTHQIADKFNLKDEQRPLLAEITGSVALKDYPISSLPELLKRELNVSDSQAQEMAMEVVKKQFLPLRQWMPEVEEYLNRIGEIRPKPAQTPRAFAPAEKPIRPTEQKETQLPQRSIREAAKINEKVLDQFITFEPIKVKSPETGDEKQASPTIRNWLRDYISAKGSSGHTEVDRSDYLFNSPNASKLSGEERNLLSEFLKSFDDPSHKIPFSQQTKLFEIEKLIKKQTGEEKKIFGTQGMVEPQTEKPQPIPFRPQPPVQPASPQTDKYLEPIEESDTPSNAIQPPKPPVSKDQGRVINLKDVA